MKNFEFEIEEDKWTGEEELSLKVGKDYWISSLLSEFINEEHSEVQLALIGMLAGEEETYDSIYDKVQEIKTGVAAHRCRGEKTFNIKL